MRPINVAHSVESKLELLALDLNQKEISKSMLVRPEEMLKDPPSIYPFILLPGFQLLNIEAEEIIDLDLEQDYQTEFTNLIMSKNYVNIYLLMLFRSSASITNDFMPLV